MEWGTFKIFQWNGKDLFLQDSTGNFVVLSHQELPNEFMDKIEVGRDIEITFEKEIILLKTQAEKNADMEKKGRHAVILRDIAALEAMLDQGIPPYAMAKLRTLRQELKQHEPEDPTAITLDQKRANYSVNPRGLRMFLKKPQ